MSTNTPNGVPKTLIAEYRDPKPAESVRYIDRVMWWCNNGHEYPQTLRARMNGRGCVYCATRHAQALAGFNDLATTHPELAKEVYDDEYDATQILAGSNKKIGWKCAKGHTWRAEVNGRKKGRGCPYCAGRRPSCGETDLFTIAPHLEEEYDDEYDAKLLTRASGVNVWWKCKNGHRWKARIYTRTRGSGCPRCRSRVSKPEQELYDWFVTICPDAEQSYNVNRKELDIYSPKHNFGIEFNGLYWHSEAIVDKNYHKEKLDYFTAAGTKIVFIWEDEWAERPDVVKKMITAKLFGRKTIGARKTKVAHIEFAQARDFLNENHIQGSAAGTDYIGLTYEDKLVAVMVVKHVSGVANLVRYASTVGVYGGMDKMMRYTGYKNWVTFADHGVSDGGLYANTGWIVDKEILPDYKYLDGGRRVHKFNYRLKNFERNSGLVYKEGMSERQLAELNGLLRIYDVGKTRYVKTL